jgi:hypothetical protein
VDGSVRRPCNACIIAALHESVVGPKAKTTDVRSHVSFQGAERKWAPHWPNGSFDPTQQRDATCGSMTGKSRPDLNLSMGRHVLGWNGVADLSHVGSAQYTSEGRNDRGRGRVRCAAREAAIRLPQNHSRYSVSVASVTRFGAKKWEAFSEIDGSNP